MRQFMVGETVDSILVKEGRVEITILNSDPLYLMIKGQSGALYLLTRKKK